MGIVVLARIIPYPPVKQLRVWQLGSFATHCVLVSCRLIIMCLCLALCKLRAALLIYELNGSSDEMSPPARIPQFLIEITHEVI